MALNHCRTPDPVFNIRKRGRGSMRQRLEQPFATLQYIVVVTTTGFIMLITSKKQPLLQA